MELQQRKQNRLPEYDYSTPTAYFVTICTANRKNLFWEPMHAPISSKTDIPLTPWGKITHESIADIPKYYPMISVDNFVVMPNHVHLLLQIHTDRNGRPLAAPTISRVINQPFQSKSAFLFGRKDSTIT